MKKSNKPKDETPKAEKAEKVEPKFGVPNLAADLGLAEASVRVGLRSLNVEKNFGNKYGWDSKEDYDEVLDALKERSANNSKKAADDAEDGEDGGDDAKPAPKKKGGKKVRRK